MESGLIVLKQLPVIEEQLELAGKEVDKRLSEVDSLVATDETVKTIKGIRADLNKEFKAFDEQRKDIKKAINKPYEEFENKFNECIGNKYKNADIVLKAKVEDVETELKNNKKAEVESYFNEYLQSKGVDFVTFEKANINVTLSASIKSLKEQAKEFIDKISNDLMLIETQEHKAEVLVEYKQSLNVSQAITTVTNRFKAIENEKQRIEGEEQFKKEIVEMAYIPASEMPVEESKHVPTIDDVEQISVDEPLEQPIEEKKEEILTLQFTVRGSRAKLRDLKKFLEDGGYDYE